MRLHHAFLLSIILLSPGCAGYERFAQTTERQYSVSYDPDTQTGALSVTLRPAIPAAAPASNLDEKQIAALVAKAIAEYAKISIPPTLKDK